MNLMKELRPSIKAFFIKWVLTASKIHELQPDPPGMELRPLRSPSWPSRSLLSLSLSLRHTKPSIRVSLRF
ncbi:hypothetical protein CsSME_00040561 [Camellia sinensis var. sinensis]